MKIRAFVPPRQGAGADGADGSDGADGLFLIQFDFHLR